MYGEFDTHTKYWKQKKQGEIKSNLPNEFVWTDDRRRTKWDSKDRLCPEETGYIKEKCNSNAKIDSCSLFTGITIDNKKTMAYF